MPAPDVSAPAGPRGAAIVRWLALACLLASVAVFLARGISAIRAVHTAPGVALTSGCEEESWFVLWRAVHGQPVYGDATQMPFASAYFNWLFYASYSVPARLAVWLGGDSRIPLGGRIFTAAGAFLGAGLLTLLFQRMLPGHTLAALAVVSLVFLGPLAGWWAHTVRPDIWALALETAALVVLLLRYRTHPKSAAVFAALLFYGAWSFKQTYFFGLGAALLFLVSRRNWSAAAILTGVSLACWLATFAALGPEYRVAFRGTATTNVYSFAAGLANLRDLLTKTAPLWLLAGAALWQTRAQPAGRQSSLAADAGALGRLGLLLVVPLTFVASCKLGAASYYYFTTTLLLALVAASGLPGLRPFGVPAAAFLGGCALQLLILAGVAGTATTRAQADGYARIWAVWNGAPEPRFAHATNLNLPWLNPGSPPLVLAFNYNLDRAAGRKFEHGGVGGLIEQGYFRSLLLPSGVGDSYDGGSLRHYRREAVVGKFALYRKSDN